MEYVRGEESRKGQAQNIFLSGEGKSQAPTGFEGMNYEQKRKPYKEKSLGGDEIGNPGASNNLAKKGMTSEEFNSNILKLS